MCCQALWGPPVCQSQVDGIYRNTNHAEQYSKEGDGWTEDAIRLFLGCPCPSITTPRCQTGVRCTPHNQTPGSWILNRRRHGTGSHGGGATRTMVGIMCVVLAEDARSPDTAVISKFGRRAPDGPLWPWY